MYNPIIPYANYTQFTPALPEFYWDVYSSEQRIKEMCCEIQKMRKYAEYLAEYVSEIEEGVDDKLQETLENVNLQISQLYETVIHMIEELQLGFLQWDVQQGAYRTTVVAQRDMFNDVTVHSYNIEELDDVFDDLDMTVDGLANSGINVKAFAVFNHVLEMPDKLPQDLVPDNPHVEGALTVSDLNNASLDVDGYVFVS